MAHSITVNVLMGNVKSSESTQCPCIFVVLVTLPLMYKTQAYLLTDSKQVDSARHFRHFLQRSMVRGAEYSEESHVSSIRGTSNAERTQRFMGCLLLVRAI